MGGRPSHNVGVYPIPNIFLAIFGNLYTLSIVVKFASVTISFLELKTIIFILADV